VAVNGRRARSAVRAAVRRAVGLAGLDLVNRGAIEQLQGKCDEAGATIERLRGQRDEAGATVEQLRQQHDQLRQQHDEAGATVEQLRQQHDQLRQQHDETTATVENLTLANEDLRQIAKEYQLKMERAQDYQVIMAQDHINAGMTNLEGEFVKLYEQCRGYTMTSWERLYALYKALRYVVDRGVPGDVVECGVWRGGSMRLAAITLLSLGAADRKLYLYDTFEGMTEPDPAVDVDLHGNRAIDDWAQIKRRDVKWSYAPIEEVWQTVISTGYPPANVVCVKGPVEKTLPGVRPERICLLRLDTDWYASTKHEIEQLYPLLSPEGVLILDDYGHYRGSQRAIDEYFDRVGNRPLMHRTDYACRCAIKPAIGSDPR
jgi:O-methyltransferase